MPQSEESLEPQALRQSSRLPSGEFITGKGGGMISRRIRQPLAAARKWGVSSMMPPKEGAECLTPQAVTTGTRKPSEAEVLSTQHVHQHESNTRFEAYIGVRKKKERLNSLLTHLYRRAGRHTEAAARIQEFLNSPHPKDYEATGLLSELQVLLKDGLSPEGYAARLRDIRARVDRLNAAMPLLALDASKRGSGRDAAEP